MNREATLQELRREIDAADAELARLFARRMALSAEIGAYKKARGLAVRDEAREREKLEAVAALLPEELRPYGERLWRELFALSRDYQKTQMDR